MTMHTNVGSSSRTLRLRFLVEARQFSWNTKIQRVNITRVCSSRVDERPNNGTVGGVERVLRPEEPPRDQAGRTRNRAVYGPRIPIRVQLLHLVF